MKYNVNPGLMNPEWSFFAYQKKQLGGLSHFQAVYIQVFPPYCHTISLWNCWLTSSPCLMVKHPKMVLFEKATRLPQNPMVYRHRRHHHHHVSYWRPCFMGISHFQTRPNIILFVTYPWYTHVISWIYLHCIHVNTLFSSSSSLQADG